MKIIIAGCGEVGYYLTKLFDQENHQITLIDKNKAKLDVIERDFGVAVVHGDSTSFRVLNQARVKQSDLLISVTTIESNNLVTAITGKSLGAKHTVARISNMEYLIDKEVFDICQAGIDDLVSPEALAAREIKQILQDAAFTETLELEDGRLLVLGLKIEEHSLIRGITIAEAMQQEKGPAFMIAAIHRKGLTIIPKGDFRFEKGDHVYFLALPTEKEKVMRFVGKNHFQIKRVMIIGGSRTGKSLAARLSKTHVIMLLEKNLERCNYLARALPGVQVVHGDGTNIQLLEQEGMENYDALVSVTGNSETNIFTCLIAKEAGVGKTIALVENIGLFDHSQNIGIDTLINKKLAAANFIFKKIHTGGVVSHLHGMDAEILEFVIAPGSRLLVKPIRDIHFPADMIVSGVIREGQAMVTLGDFQFRKGDKVVVFSLPAAISKVKAFFSL